LFPTIALPDRAALLKWKWMLAPDRLTEADWAEFDRFQRARRLWPFNRKYFKALESGRIAHAGRARVDRIQW